MNLASKCVLITGGAGFVGGRLAEALLARGARVRVLDVRRPEGSGRAARDVDVVLGDVADAGTWPRALAGIDAVFHLAAVVGADTDARRYLDVNGGGTAELFRALERGPTRVRKVVVASSLGVYGEGDYQCERDGLQHPELRSLAQLERHEWEPHCPTCGRRLAWRPTGERSATAPVSAYAISKHAAERLALSLGRRLDVPTVALRYAVVYGDGQPLVNPYSTVITSFATQLARGDTPVIFEDGEQRRDWIHVDDAVRATLFAAEDNRTAFEVFNVGGGRASSVIELARLLARRLGREVVLEPSRRFRLGDYRHLVLDTGKLHALGFAPALSLERGLDRFVDWLRSPAAAHPAGSSRPS